MDFFQLSRTTLPTASKRLFVFGGVGLLVVAAVLFAYFGTEISANERKGSKGPPAIPVSVAQVAQEVVPFRLQAIGNVEAYATVSVKARVDGQIVEVGFKEGEEVPRGRLLFKIDPRPYQAALRQAEANFLRDTAQKDQARSQERRYQELLAKNFVSKEAYAQIRTNADTAEAVAQGSRAALDNATLNLEYCTVRSPSRRWRRARINPQPREPSSSSTTRSIRAPAPSSCARSSGTVKTRCGRASSST